MGDQFGFLEAPLVRQADSELKKPEHKIHIPENLNLEIVQRVQQPGLDHLILQIAFQRHL